MQDRYAGDVGDFSKFALCRALHRDVGGPLGVIWYLYPHAEANNDGKHRDYLGHPDWRDCEEDLQRALHEIAHSDERSVRRLEEAGVLLDDTKYFSEPICHPRKTWFDGALTAVADTKVVIVDPDNGIAGVNHRPGSGAGGKHITQEEIQALTARHPCTVIYHHFDRSATHDVQMLRLKELLLSLALGKDIYVMRYSRISPRAYFIVSDPEISEGVRMACDSLTQGQWSKHFTHH